MQLNEIDKQLTTDDLEALETFADRIFAKVGIDVEFTRHFLDRVNDERNGKQITASELTRLFKQEYKKWGKPIANMGPDAEAVMKDLATDINMPFVLNWDKKNNELDLIAKTVMRKPDFKTSNREFPVEGRGLYSMGGKSGYRGTPTSHDSRTDTLSLPITLPVGSLEKSRKSWWQKILKQSKDNKNTGKPIYEYTISDLKGMGITLTREQRHRLQKISHENSGNITRSDLKKVGIKYGETNMLEAPEEECPACGGTGWDRSVTPDEDDRGCDECGGTGEIEDLDALKNEDAMSAEEIGKYPDLAWTNVNDTQEVKTYLNNMSHKNRVKIEAFRQRVTEPQFQTFLKGYMTDHPDKPYDSVDSKPVTTNAPVKGHHNEDAVSDQVKGSDPMPKAKPGRTDHPYRGKLVGSKYNEEEYDFADVRQKRIAIDTVKNPNKALLGGPSASEAEDILKTKFGYSDNQIAKLKGDDEPQFMASKEQGKLAQAWSNGANNIKSGDIELIRGEDGAHIIQKNSWEIGDFSLDTDSDLWVVNIDGEEGQGTYGSIDDIVKSLDSITEEWYKPWTWGKKPTAKDLPGSGTLKKSGTDLENRNKQMKQALDALKNESVIKEETGISKFNKEDPNNPEVYIDGYGSLMLNQIEDDLVRNFTSLTDMAKKKDWDGIEYQLNQTGVLQAKIEAILNTKEQLQAIRRKGGPKSRGINKESLYDALMGEGVLDPFKVIKHKRAYERAADTLHTMLQRKYKENEGNWRHGFGWYVAKIADGFNHVDSDVLNKYYLDHYKSAFITETGGVGRVVQGVNTSVDVGPNEIKKQAAKFGNVVNKDGLPKKTFR